MEITKNDNFVIGHRYLVNIGKYLNQMISEVVVVEKSTTHIKLMFLLSTGDIRTEWEQYSNIKIVEDLGIYGGSII